MKNLLSDCLSECIKYIPAGIIISNTKGDIIHANTELCNLLGYNSVELSMMNISDIILKNEQLLTHEVLEQLTQHSIPHINIEKQLYTKNNSIIWVSIKASFIETSEDINNHFILVFDDITEKKEAEQKLSVREHLLMLFVKHTPAAIAMFNNKMEYIAASDRFLKDYHLLENNIIGKCHYDIFPEIPERWKQIHRDCLSGATMSEDEDPFPRADGTLDWVKWEILPWYNNNGNIGGIILFSEVITPHKEAEHDLIKKNEEIKMLNREYISLNKVLNENVAKLRQLNEELLEAKNKAEESDRLKTSFLQNMSHEIRTPLNAILGFSDILPEKFNDKQKLKKFTDIIKQRGIDLLDIINDILDIAKIESGQIPIHTAECNIQTLIEEIKHVITGIQQKFKKTHIEFKVISNHHLSSNVIIIDYIKLKQILMNLLSNAFKFTNTGYVQLEYYFIDNQNIKFRIIDTGIGIAKEHQDDIFERFIQLQNISSHMISGTGLGLSIVKGLLNILGGEITVTSDLNKGSCFEFTFPYKITHNDISPTIKLSNKQSPPSNLNILIVEDDESNTFYLEELLNSTDVKLYKTMLGKDALKIVEQKNINVILLDIKLPDISGIEVAKIIKKSNPQIFIIAQSAYASHDDEKLAINAGCDAFVAKPIDKKILFLRLNESVF